MTDRFHTKRIRIGNTYIGGGSPVAVQSMLNVPAGDVEGNVAQAGRLEAAGCEILRVAVPNREAVRLIPAIKSAVAAPLVADIHFDYRLALESVAAGADKIRINPGNIGDGDRVRQVAEACRERGVPIRVGVNSGSLEKDILARYGGPTAEALAESALRNVALLERFDFTDIVLSIKSSDVPTVVAAYTLVAERTDYPLHIGVTEAGTARTGLVKSAAGLGALLLRGIGDTLRVSLTADPVEEVKAARDILSACGTRRFGVRLVSCPTCGRTKIDLISLARRVEDALRDCPLDITVAVMGCEVNGPGEAREADIGVAGGDGCGVIFRRGEIVRRVPESGIVPELLAEVESLAREKGPAKV